MKLQKSRSVKALKKWRANVPDCRHRSLDEEPPPPVETSWIIAPTPPQQQLLAGITRTSAVEVAVGDSHIGQMTFVMDRRCAFKGSTSRSWWTHTMAVMSTSTQSKASLVLSCHRPVYSWDQYYVMDYVWRGKECSVVVVADSSTWAMCVSGSDVAWTDYSKITPLGGCVWIDPPCVISVRDGEVGDHRW